MKHFNLIKTFLLLFALVVGGGSSAWADYTKVMECDMTTKSYGTSSYNSSTTYGDWTIVNGANNNKGWTYFKMGGKSSTLSSANPCYIYSTAAAGSRVDKVTVHIPSGSLSKSGMSVKSWGVYVYSDKAMNTQVDYVAGGTITNSEGTFDFTPSEGKVWSAGYYYKVSWNLVNTTTTNGVVCVDKITLYQNPAPLAPTFDPAEGDFSDDFTLHLACATEGSSIYYTIDGTTPTSNSTLYNDATGISISAGANVTVKAIAVKAGVSSEVSSATYTYKNIANPLFTVPSGSTVLYGESVSISCATDGADIYYTTNGDTPTSASTKYTTPIVLNEGVTIKAIAINGGDESEVVSATYSVKATAPTFSVDEGTYNTTQSVSLGTTTDGATIYYTIDGSEPTSSSTVYSTAIDVTAITTIKAIAIKAGLTDSEVASATYTLKVLAPTFSIPEGDYDEEQNVELSCATDDAKIYYTFSGTPSSSSTLYSGAITISDIKTVRAIAIKDGWENSDMSTAEYRVVIPASLPFSFDGGKNDIASTIGLTQEGLGSDYSSKPYLKFDHTDDNLILKFNSCPGILSFDIKGNGFSGGTFKVQYSVDGTDYIDMEEYTSLGDKKTETFNNIPATARYIKWIYTNKSNGNVGLGNIKLTNTKEIKISEAGYATYCSSAALDFTGITTLTAYTASKDNNTNAIIFNKVEGKVPANTGLLVSGETTNVPVCASAEAVTNLLVGVTTATVKDAGTVFVLMNGSKGIGFYKNTYDFTVRANSAYLPAEEVAGARAFIGFDGEATGIAEVNTQKEDAKRMFDLQGRKVTKAAKGLYIVDGRKVVVK